MKLYLLHITRFLKVEKLNISAIYKQVILIFFSESSFGIYLHVSLEIHIQLPGEPREQHLGEVRQEMLKSKFNISNHRNFSVNLPIVFIYVYFVI